MIWFDLIGLTRIVSNIEIYFLGKNFNGSE